MCKQFYAVIFFVYPYFSRTLSCVCPFSNVHLGRNRRERAAGLCYSALLYFYVELMDGFSMVMSNATAPCRHTSTATEYRQLTAAAAGKPSGGILIRFRWWWKGVEVSARARANVLHVRMRFSRAWHAINQVDYCCTSLHVAVVVVVGTNKYIHKDRTYTFKHTHSIDFQFSLFTREGVGGLWKCVREEKKTIKITWFHHEYINLSFSVGCPNNLLVLVSEI